jgi:hypothetical protein
MIRFTLVLMILVSASACRSTRPDFWDTQLNPLLSEFEEQDQAAASAPRGSLSPIIGQMTFIRTQIEDLYDSNVTPNCAVNGMSALLVSSSSVISAAQDWETTESKWSSKQLQDHDQRVVRQWTSAYEAFLAAHATIKEDCGF